MRKLYIKIITFFKNILSLKNGKYNVKNIKKSNQKEIVIGLDVMGINPKLRQVQQSYLERTDNLDDNEINKNIANEMKKRTVVSHD